MKKRVFALLCVLFLLCAAIPVSAEKAPGGDFAWTSSTKPMLIEQILQRDGLIDGIWFPWFDGGNVGHSLTGNELMVRYYGSGWSRPALDTVGADKIYHEIYNLKAMGYNLLGYGGSIYDEGVIHDEYGDVLGVKQEFLDNARRLLNMCREIGMPVMWTICFHSSSSPNYHGMDAYNIMAQKYANPTIAKHYAERFARPVCEMLAEYPDVVALVAVTDEIENEINDSQEGNHFGGARDHYGVTEEDMVYFMQQVTKVAREELPNTALTMASNDKNKSMYNGFDMDMMGHNMYDNNVGVPDADVFFSDAPMLLTEYNIGHDGKFTPEQFANKLILYRQRMMERGYKGGVQWAWMSNGMHRSTAYYLLDGYANDGPNTNFLETVAILRHFIDDYRAEYRGETVVLDKPVLYANEGGGYVEWIPSRQAETMDILRSTDGGKTWQTILQNVNQSDYVNKGKGRYKDTAIPNSMYKIVVRDGKGNTAESEPNNVAGIAAKYKKAATTVKLDGATGIGRDYSWTGNYSLYEFSTAQNRPYTETANLIKNGSFESTADAAWNVSTFVGDAVSVVTDKTAPEGGKSLYFNTSGNTTEKWYTFTVPVQPGTNYVFSAWVKGAYLSANNSGHASIGVVDPSTGKFMLYPSYRTRPSRANRQIYPTAWDEEWHLRSVCFNSADLTEVTIALCGENSKLWVDGLALYENGHGIKYVGERNSSRLVPDMTAEALTCKDSVCLTKNSSFTSGNTYWKDGAGWRNGFLAITDSDKTHGKALHYTAGDADGVYYVQWMDVKPHTDYSFAFDIKILQAGGGKLMIIDDAMSLPQVLFAFEMDTDVYGKDWGSYYLKFNTGAFTRVGIAMCDLGGEALMDNIRFFKTADGTKPTGGTVSTVATVKPTSTTTTTVVVKPTDPTTATVSTPTPATGSIAQTTLASSVTGESLPSNTEVGDPTVSADPSVQGSLTNPTEAKGDKGDTPAQGNKDENNRDFPWVIVGIAGGVALLVGSTVTILLILKKKKRTQ